MTSGFFRREWDVRDADFAASRKLVEELHYARGGSNTFVYVHGLFRKSAPDDLAGVAWWIPPTRVACESVNREHWTRVLSLTRMVIRPEVPRNAASFLLAGSVRAIRADGRFLSLVTYADESQGHDGGVYRAANWTYAGRTGPYPRWVDPVSGRQVAVKSTVNRTKAQMLDLGFTRTGSFFKHKFILHLDVPPRSHHSNPAGVFA